MVAQLPSRTASSALGTALAPQPVLPLVGGAVWLGVVVGRCEVHGGRAQRTVGYGTLGCATPLPENCVPAVPLTLCQPRLEVAGRRAGGSWGALRGPSSTHSARAAGQGCCSTARCLLGRQSQGREGAATPWPPKTHVLHLTCPRPPSPHSPRHGCLHAVPVSTAVVGMAAHQRSGVSPQPLPVTRVPRRHPWTCHQACCAPGCGTLPLAAGSGEPPRCWPGSAPMGQGPG